MNLSTLRAVQTFPTKMATSILWSADGQKMRTSGYQSATEFDSTWSSIQPVDFPAGHVDGESWSRDARVKIVAQQADAAMRANAHIYRDGALVRTHELAAEGMPISSLHAGISPDGRWAGMSAFQGIAWHVWNTENGKEVASGAQSATIRFSPDGRWLIVCGGATNELWDTRTWLRVKSWPRNAAGLFGRAAWTADGRLLAIQPTRRNITLLKTTDWTEIATLQIPEQSTVCALEFSPGGNQLAAAIKNGAVAIYSLTKLRSELRELGLDWE